MKKMFEPLTREDFSNACYILLGMTVCCMTFSLYFFINKNPDAQAILYTTLLFGFLFVVFAIYFDIKLKKRGE